MTLVSFCEARSAWWARTMDHDELVNRRVNQIACDHGVTVADVQAALDRHPFEVNVISICAAGWPSS